MSKNHGTHDRKPFIPKEQRPLYKAAKKQGWDVVGTKKNHNRWISPQGKSLFHSQTPSDWRSTKNFTANLRKNGLDV